MRQFIQLPAGPHASLFKGLAEPLAVSNLRKRLTVFLSFTDGLRRIAERHDGRPLLVTAYGQYSSRSIKDFHLSVPFSIPLS